MTNIANNQNLEKNIIKLKAQSQAYSDVKLWMIYSVSIGIAIPCIVSFLTFAINNDYFSTLFNFQKKDWGYFSVTIGILSSLLVEVFSRIINLKKEEAAKIQECFDTSVFNLSWDDISVGSRPDVSIILDKSNKFDAKHPNYNGFDDWYTPIAANFRYPQSIILCQQQNLCWDNYLRKPLISYSYLCLTFVILFILLLGMYNDPSFRNFLTNVFALLLPVIMYFYKLISEHKDAMSENQRLQTLNEKMRDEIKDNISDNDIINRCRVIQTSIYQYRKSVRPVPNWLHMKNKDQQEKNAHIRVEDFISK